MMDRKMMNFIKEQYPPGTRIRLNSMDDPYHPILPGTEGEVDFVDDEGQIFMKWDNGRTLPLVPGEDSFTVLPPKLTTLKLYMPLTADLYERNEYGEFDDTRDKTSYWQESSILYILHNEKYAGDCLLQKTYTAQELPRFRKRNLGKYRQVFVKQSHPAIIERDKFERVQELLKRKRIAFAGDSVSTPFSKKIKCAECGSTFRLKKVRGKNYWTCMAHEKDVHKCSMLPLPEEQVLQAFLRLYYKLKYYGIGVLTQLISDLRAARTGSLLWSENIVEINKQISDIASQERLLTQLKQQGSVNPDIFISRSNLLAERRRELKLQKERILRSEEDHTIHQAQDLLDVLECGPDWMDDFDEQLFSDLVEKIVVVDNEKLCFRLLNGLEVTEKIERTQR